jgi:anti-sigma B factor antagonist
MMLTTYIEHKRYVIELRGDLDVYAVPMLDQALADALVIGPSILWINFRDVHYLSPASLGVLVSHLPDIQQRGIQLFLFNVEPPIQHIFEDLGLDKRVTILKGPEVPALIASQRTKTHPT